MRRILLQSSQKEREPANLLPSTDDWHRKNHEEQFDFTSRAEILKKHSKDDADDDDDEREKALQLNSPFLLSVII